MKSYLIIIAAIIALVISIYVSDFIVGRFVVSAFERQLFVGEPVDRLTKAAERLGGRESRRIGEPPNERIFQLWQYWQPLCTVDASVYVTLSGSVVSSWYAENEPQC